MRISWRSPAARRIRGAGIFLAFAVWGGAAHSTLIPELEPNNDFATAQNLDSSFSLDFSADIGDMTGANTSTTIPHASVRATGDGTLDYYSFTVAAAGTKVILDIDYGAPNFDSALWLFHASDLVNEVRNDYDTTFVAGAGGSVGNVDGTISDDSFIEYVAAQAGLYFVLVGSQAAGLPGYSDVPDGASYQLHVSVDQAISVPVPALLPLFAAGLLGLAASRRRKA